MKYKRPSVVVRTGRTTRGTLPKCISWAGGRRRGEAETVLVGKSVRFAKDWRRRDICYLTTFDGWEPSLGAFPREGVDAEAKPRSSEIRVGTIWSLEYT